MILLIQKGKPLRYFIYIISTSVPKVIKLVPMLKSAEHENSKSYLINLSILQRFLLFLKFSFHLIFLSKEIMLSILLSVNTVFFRL